MTTLKPTAAIAKDAQIVTVEDLVFGGDPAERARCPVTNRRYENGSGCLPREEQTKMFQREAALAERKAEIEREATREAAASAATAAAVPKLRLISTFANARISDFKTDDPEI